MTVSNYNLQTSSGKHIRVATQVTLPNGQVIRFAEKLTRKEAIRNAQAQIERQRTRVSLDFHCPTCGEVISSSGDYVALPQTIHAMSDVMLAAHRRMDGCKG